MMGVLKRFSRDTGGSALVEAALILPFLLVLTLGIFQFELLLNQEIMVANAAAAGGLQASVSRGDTGAYTNIVNAVNSAAPGLTAANLTVAICVPTTGSNPSCTSANSCGSSTCYTDYQSAQGKQVTVTVSYSCSALFVFGGNWTFMNTGSVCPISTSATQIIQ